MTTASSVQTDDLAGKRALVSGGTRGTGAAVAARLKGAGATLCERQESLTDSSRGSRFSRTCRTELASGGFSALIIRPFFGTDVSVRGRGMLA
jgi:NAD(P)-dependent dehydrogenase (short-subunit alcohol dehydrogenase family)